MKKIYFVLSILSTVFWSFGQSEYLKSGISHSYELTITLNSLGQNNTNGIVNSLNSIQQVKYCNVIDPTTLQVVFHTNETYLPNILVNNAVQNTINQFSSKMVFADLESVLNSFKEEKVSHKTLMLSGLSNKTDVQNLIEDLVDGEKILFINADFNTHEAFFIYNSALTGENIKDMLNASGKNIIESNQELSKYY